MQSDTNTLAEDEKLCLLMETSSAKVVVCSGRLLCRCLSRCHRVASFGRLFRGRQMSRAAVAPPANRAQRRPSKIVTTARDRSCCCRAFKASNSSTSQCVASRATAKTVNEPDRNQTQLSRSRAHLCSPPTDSAATARSGYIFVVVVQKYQIPAIWWSSGGGLLGEFKVLRSVSCATLQLCNNFFFFAARWPVWRQFQFG